MTKPWQVKEGMRLIRNDGCSLRVTHVRTGYFSCSDYGDYLNDGTALTYYPEANAYIDNFNRNIDWEKSLAPKINIKEEQEATEENWDEYHNLRFPADQESSTPTKLNVKDTNPKDSVGIRKWRQFCTIPFTVMWEIGVAMLEGARKYGRHNYRVAGVRAHVYIDAAVGHISQWWEGEDIDPDSGVSHITKAIASLVVLRDAMIQGKCVDDRPPKTNVAEVRARLQKTVEDIFERIPEAKAAYIEGDQDGGEA